MAHPAYLREKARSLRCERRLTIDELAERLALSRSTIYYWVRDLSFERTGRANAGQRRGNRAMRRKYRLLREAAYQDGLTSFDELALDPTFRDFVCLYIAEGYKRDRNSVAICNSDGAVLVLAVRWIRRLSCKRPEFAIQYHADQNLAELRRFWAELLGIDPEAIRWHRKSNSGHLKGRGWRSRHGVLTTRVSDTYLRARIEAWMHRLQREWCARSG
jgi:transcriptional regulator with XRE-family HTH domain